MQSLSRWLATVLTAIVLAPAIGGAQSVRDDLDAVDGSVSAIAVSGNTIYIGGNFTRVGPATGAAVPLDAGTGQVLAFPRVNGTVSAIAPDGNGGWYVGGLFTEIGGAPRSNLAHIQANHTLSPWSPAPDGPVFALAVAGATVYAGGAFTNIGGQQRNRIAAIDATSGTATGWNPNADNLITALALSGSTVYAGGAFANIGGQARNLLAGLDATTGAATSWNARPLTSIVKTLLVSGTTLYVGGSYFLAGYSISTGTITWDPQNPDGAVSALAVSGNTVYVGGDFSFIGTQPRHHIAAFNANNGNLMAWNPVITPDQSAVEGLVASGQTVYVGGSFTMIGGQTRRHLAAIDAMSGDPASWSPGANGTVHAMALSGTVVYAGGDFTHAGGTPRNYLAAIDAVTGSVTAWNPNPNGFVGALAFGGGVVYAGGSFTSAGGQPRNNIAALDAVTGNATEWNPNANGFLNALAVDGGTVYAGGFFTHVGGQPRNFIAALDAATGNATAWDPDADDGPYAMAVSGGTVYVGGSFTHVGGELRRHIAALDASTGDVLAWNPDASLPDDAIASVLALSVSGTTVYVGGQFESIGGQLRNHIAALDMATGNASPWDPDAGTCYLDCCFSCQQFCLFCSSVSAIAVAGPRIYAGGYFGAIGEGSPMGTNLVALDPTSGGATWQPQVDGAVSALVASGTTVYVGGAFRRFGGLLQTGFAAILDARSVDVDPPVPVPAFGLTRLSPNPSSGRVDIEFVLPEATQVRLDVFDVQGRVLEHLLSERREAGRHFIPWSTNHLKGNGPGAYFVRLETARGSQTKTFFLLK